MCLEIIWITKEQAKIFLRQPRSTWRLLISCSKISHTQWWCKKSRRVSSLHVKKMKWRNSWSKECPAYSRLARSLPLWGLQGLERRPYSTSLHAGCLPSIFKARFMPTALSTTLRTSEISPTMLCSLMS